MSLTDLEMDLLLANAEIATLKREAKGNMFTVPDDFVKIPCRCKDCVSWDTKADYCHNPCGLSATGKKARENYCPYGERKKPKDGDNHG